LFDLDGGEGEVLLFRVFPAKANVLAAARRRLGAVLSFERT
jgi:hypothetical protein